MVGVYLTLNGIRTKCQVTSVLDFQGQLGLEEFGGQAGHFAAFAGRQGDVPEALLTPEGMDQHGKGVVRLTHIRSVDLARVAGEDHLGALADAGEDGLERRRFEVL